MFKKRQKHNKAFTLIELLVVISIISLLATIILASLNIARAKGRDSAKVQTLQEVRNALNLYFADKGYYPDTAELATSLTTNAKYISTVSPDLRYAGLECTNQKCSAYHVGIILENTDNNILNTDSDATSTGANGDFNGQSCGDSTDGGDICYDYTTLVAGSGEPVDNTDRSVIIVTNGSGSHSEMWGTYPASSEPSYDGLFGWYPRGDPAYQYQLVDYLDQVMYQGTSIPGTWEARVDPNNYYNFDYYDGTSIHVEYGVK